jgi:predicted DNA-binding transcriptional regulator AlpA
VTDDVGSSGPLQDRQRTTTYGKPDMPRLLDTFQAAEVVCLSRSTLAKLRLTGGGPRFIRLGSKVVYDEADLTAWLDSQPRLASTSAT